LADDPDRRASMGRAARRYAMAHLDREQVLAGFLAALTAAVDRRARAAPAPSDEDALPEPASGGLTPPLA
jgi:hypothetical protein